MGRVRVFYGHGEVVPPTGSSPRSAAPAGPSAPDVDEVIATSLDGDAVELLGEPIAEDVEPEVELVIPDDSWSTPELEAFAEANGIDLTGAKKNKGEKLARILSTLKEQ